jgi:hypothetical protein
MSNGAEPKRFGSNDAEKHQLGYPDRGWLGAIKCSQTVRCAHRYRYPMESKWMIETSTAETLRRDFHNAGGNIASNSMSIFDTALNGGK